MAAFEQTLSGIQPAETNKVPFIESTARVEQFLQKKFDGIIEMMNNEITEWNNAHPDEDQKELQEAVEVNLITMRMSSKFYPFLLILPASVLKDRSNRRIKDELEIFNPQHTERSAKVKDPLYEIIAPFMYDNRDKESFFTPTLQHELKISSRTSSTMKINCRPKVHSFDKGRTNYVMVFLDPLRLFHNMATPLNGSKFPFRISIERVEQIKGSNYKYYFERVLKTGKNKGKKDSNFEHQVVQAINRR